MDNIILSDVFWNSNFFTMSLNNIDESLINGSIEFSDKPSRPSKSLIDIKLYKKLVDIKNKIPNCLHWDKWVKFANPYEKVQNLSKYNHPKEYYKFYEIIKFYNLLQNLKNSVSIHLGNDSYSAVKVFLDMNENIDWYVEKNDDKNQNKYTSPSSSGVDIKFSESDLEFYSSKNISGKSRFLKYDDIFNINVMSIITCDVTDDYDHDPINKEQLSFKTFFKYVLSSLKLQEIGGFTVYKIYDIVTRPSCQLIYYLTNFYETVEIIKPRTSRFSNSEKFVIAKNFKGINLSEIEKLDGILQKWDNDLYCRLLGVDIPEIVENKFMEYNSYIVNIQCEYMEKIFSLSYNDDSVAEKQLSAFQNKKTIDFCKSFGIKISLIENFTCKHLKKTKFLVPELKNCMICNSCYQLVI